MQEEGQEGGKRDEEGHLWNVDVLGLILSLSNLAG
jgi:hypothetical protein